MLLAFFFFCNLFLLCNIANASSPATDTVTGEHDLSGRVAIRHINISGNRTTKKGIILRELTFHQNDTMKLAMMAQLLEINRQNVFNTRLFNVVTLDTVHISGSMQVDINITVIERWYIWPIPFLEVSDRNFNVWWETRELSRLTYGIDFTFFNARGRNETLKIMTHFGFNQLYGFNYRIPALNRQQTIGTSFGGYVQLNHEVAVYTMNNKPVYLRSNSTYLKKAVYGFGEVLFRPDLYSTHSLRLAYSGANFDSSLLSIPGYTDANENPLQFVTVSYLFKADYRDVHFYPLKGYYIDAEVSHSIPYNIAHNSYLKSNMRLYLQLQKRWFWASRVTGKVSFEKTQPYYLQRGLGWGQDYVRGYEYYVIDGQHFILQKNNLKFALVPRRVEKLQFIPAEKFNTVPWALYVNAFVDMGYVYHYPGLSPGAANGTNNLQNHFLLGYGLGLDFTTYYDVVVRIESTLNLMNQPGIYFHFTAPI